MTSASRRADVHREIEEVADSFEAVWRERAELNERVHILETEVARHVELETLLRSTLVSAERAAHDMKDQARREAEVTVAEASAEGRKLVRDAIAEKERLLAESRRVETILRAALEVISEGRSNDEERAEVMRRPSFPAATDTGADRLAG